jgi:hypothetical protein
VILGFVGVLSACQNNSTYIPEPIIQAKIIIKQLSPNVILDQETMFAVEISSPKAGKVGLGFSAGSYAQVPEPVIINFGRAETKTIEFKVTPRQVTPLNLIVSASGSDWSDRQQLKLRVSESYASLQTQSAEPKQFSNLAEYSQTLEKARIAEKRTQALESEIVPLQPNAVRAQNADVLDTQMVQYLYNTGATPIDPAQLDEPIPAASKSNIRPQGWGCSLGPIETVRFLIRNRPLTPISMLSSKTSLSDFSEPDFMRGTEYDYPETYPIRKAKIIVYDHNGAWRNVIAEGYLDDTGKFSYARPTCDTGVFFDWSHYDPQYEVITESPTHIVTNWVQLQSPRIVTGVYWDLPPQNRTIIVDANDGEASRYLWTLNLTQYAQDFLGNGTKVNVRMNPIGTFAPIGQVFLNSIDWASLYPLIHEIGHNTLYIKTYPGTSYNGCIGQFIPCVPDFAPLITIGCPNTPNTETGLTSCTTYLTSGFAHIPQNYTYFYATNEGWAQATHMLAVQYFNMRTSRNSTNNLPFYPAVDSRNCIDPGTCAYPNLIRSTNEYYMGTLYYRLITEFVAEWSVRGYQTLLPNAGEVEEAKNAWRRIQSNVIPYDNTSRIASTYFGRLILMQFQSKLTSEATKTKVCNILKDTGMTNIELADFTISNSTVFFLCQR